MENNALKIPTCLVNTVLYGFMLYIIWLSGQKIDLRQCYLSLFYGTPLDSTKKAFGLVIIIGIPLSLLFSFIMRSIDNYLDRHKGGLVWIAGVISGVAAFGAMYYVLGTGKSLIYNLFRDNKDLLETYTGILLFVFIALGVIICMAATFMKSNSGGRNSEDGVSSFMRIANEWNNKH